MDEFAADIRQIRENLPIVESEIGDTWIHGIATDPLKVSQFRRLMLLKEKWITDGLLTPDMPAYHSFMETCC